MLMLAHAERCRPCMQHSDSEKSSSECPSNKACISWVGQGKAIEINDREDFLQSLVPLFFDAKKIKFVSFVRKLNRWGFRRTDAASAGSSSTLGEYHGRAVFSHPFFDRDNRHLVHKMRCITTMSTADILHRHQEENPETADLPASKQDPDEDESSSVKSRTCSPLLALTTTGKAGEGSSHCSSPGSFSQQDFSTVSLRHCSVPNTTGGAGGAQSSVPAAARNHPVDLQRVLSDPIRYAGLTTQNVAGGLHRPPHGLSSGLAPMTMFDAAEGRSLSVPSNLHLLQNRLLQSQRLQQQHNNNNNNSLIPLIQHHSSSLLGGPVTGQRHNYSAASLLGGAADDGSRRNTLVDQLVASRRVAASDNNTDIFHSVVRTLPDASMNLQWQHSQNTSLLHQSHANAASPWAQQQQQQSSSLVTAAAAASLARRQEIQSFRDLQQQLRHASAHGLSAAAASETRPTTTDAAAAAAAARAAAFHAYAAATAERGTPHGPFDDQHSLDE